MRVSVPLGTPAAAALCLLTSPAFGQTPISGSLSDATTGPLLTGVVYHTTSNISVASTETLTIQPGAIVKFGFDDRFDVFGTLLCNGTGVDSVIFTDLRDDTAGGDTNGDGNATAPAPDLWRGVQFTAGSSASQVSGLTVRYGGRFSSNFNLSACDATFTDCRSELCNTHSWNLLSSSFPTLTNCAAVDSNGEAFFQAPLGALPSFSGLTASGNLRNRLLVSAATVSGGASIALDPSNLLDGSFTTSGNITVTASSTLTLGAGTSVKFAFDRTVNVAGTLICNGTASEPVVFTDERDDSVAGDSNGDGNTTSPSAGYWRGLQLGGGLPVSTLQHVEVRYPGRFVSGLELNQSDAVISNCKVFESSGGGIDLNTNSFPAIDSLRIENCAGEAVDEVDIHALVGMSGLDLVGNDLNRVHVTAAQILSGESLTLHPGHAFQNTLFMDANLTPPTNPRKVPSQDPSCVSRWSGTLRYPSLPSFKRATREIEPR